MCSDDFRTPLLGTIDHNKKCRMYKLKIFLKRIYKNKLVARSHYKSMKYSRFLD